MAGPSPSEVRTALRRFGLENDRLDAAVARAVGASPAEFKAMDHLHAAGELTAGQLGQRMSLSSGAVTALIDRLVRLGWAERSPHPTDRRSVVVRPCGPGDTSPRVYSEYADEVGELAKALSPAERKALVGFLSAAGEAAARRARDLRGD